MHGEVERAHWFRFWRPRIDNSPHPLLTNHMVDLLEEVLEPAHAFNPAAVRRYLFMVQEMLERFPERRYHLELQELERAAQRARETNPVHQG
jgi:hypothetical protein